MSRESISKLAALTGYARETISKRLAELTPELQGRSHLYESREALPILYGYESDSGYDLTEERARLAHHQANNEGLKELENKGDLVRAADVVRTWQEKIAAARAQLLSLPSKAAPMAASADSEIAIEALIRKLVHEALDELSGTGLPNDLEQRMDSISRGLESAT